MSMTDALVTTRIECTNTFNTSVAQLPMPPGVW